MKQNIKPMIQNKQNSSTFYLISLPEFNLPLIGSFTWLTPPGPYRATTFLWPHKDMESFPGWVISSMPGPPPRQHKHERRYTPGTHSVIPIRWIWNDDYGGQMVFGVLVSLKIPDICLTGEEKPRKTSPRKSVPTGDRTRARCVTGVHVTACSTVVDSTIYKNYKGWKEKIINESLIQFVSRRPIQWLKISLFLEMWVKVVCNEESILRFLACIFYAK